VTLIDSIGDIISKARSASGVTLAAAAQAGGISLAHLETLERTGQSPVPVNLTALAPVIGLHPAKLQRIASGWLPHPRDPGLWREWRVITSSREGLTVNCYIVWDEVSREGALFDTGWDAGPILEVWR
jgi:hypothetical protein